MPSRKLLDQTKNFIASIILVNWEHFAIKLKIDVASDVKIFFSRKTDLWVLKAFKFKYL